jgi:hypothetical protein
MKQAKRKPRPMHLYVAWDGTLHATPITKGDPTLADLVKAVREAKRRKA